jgi:hypothetical protein
MRSRSPAQSSLGKFPVWFRHSGGQAGKAEQPGFEDFPRVEGEPV